MQNNKIERYKILRGELSTEFKKLNEEVQTRGLELGKMQSRLNELHGLLFGAFPDPTRDVIEENSAGDLEFIVPTSAYAHNVVEAMADRILVYGHVTVSDLNDFLNRSSESTHNDENWGWTDIGGWEIKPFSTGEYIVVLPRPERVDDLMISKREERMAQLPVDNATRPSNRKQPEKKAPAEAAALAKKKATPKRTPDKKAPAKKTAAKQAPVKKTVTAKRTRKPVPITDDIKQVVAFLSENPGSDKKQIQAGLTIDGYKLEDKQLRALMEKTKKRGLIENRGRSKSQPSWHVIKKI